ncbi:MAG: sigma 54-interacting transcriptional regulator [Muribaculum sp.]|nr:sigma 54-interacting transcriptional regulator [Muribaculum sp.]
MDKIENLGPEPVINFGSDKILVYSKSNDGLDEIGAMLRRSGADYTPENDFNIAKQMLKSGKYTAFMSDVTDLENSGLSLLEFARHLSKVKITSFGFIRTEYPNVVAEVYLVGADQCLYHSEPEIEHMTHMMAHLYANHRKEGWMKKIADERNKVLASFHKDPHKVVPILMYGQPGTGKIAFSQIFHAIGGRKNHYFVLVKCKPKYNYAGESRFGLNNKQVKERIQESIEMVLGHAMHGTVFFHEITNLTPAAQEVLAEVINVGKCRTSINGRKVNFHGRIVVSTSESLKRLESEGKFSKELFDILQRNKMTMPSLAEYKDEIPTLAQTFVTTLCIKANITPKTFTEKAKEALMNRLWRGNIIELYNVVEESLSFASGSKIDLPDLPLNVEADELANNEKNMLIRLLKETDYNKSEVAVRLKISRGTLYRKLRKHNIELDKPE